MLANFILLAIALLVLYFVGLLWLRHNLLDDLHELQRREGVLMKDFEKSRDQVPLLLESLRTQQDTSDTWRKIVADRANFHTQTSLVAEENFQKELMDFLSQSSIRSVDFLEAKKSIEEVTALIAAQKKEIESASKAFNEKRRQFPYTLAAGIFGFKELGV